MLLHIKFYEKPASVINKLQPLSYQFMSNINPRPPPHASKPLKYTKLLHYSNIPNTHKKLHTRVVYRRQKYTLPQRLVLQILDNKNLFQNFRLKGETNRQILSKQVLKKQFLLSWGFTVYVAVLLSLTIGHFRVPKTLTFKMRRSAQPFLWKWVLFSREWKIIFISKAEQLISFCYRGPGELGNGLLKSVVRANMGSLHLKC